jgi:hypothetical protein
VKTVSLLIFPASLIAASAVAQTTVSMKPKQSPGHAILQLENGQQDVLRIEHGEARASLPNIMANDVDYVTVVGTQTIVTLYADPNFKGRRLTLRCGHYELLQQPRNDIESVQVSIAKTPVKTCQGSEQQLVQLKTWER